MRKLARYFDIILIAGMLLGGTGCHVLLRDRNRHEQQGDQNKRGDHGDRDDRGDRNNHGDHDDQEKRDNHGDRDDHH
jgi:hypothetical protein